jgi:hypothetical protein
VYNSYQTTWDYDWDSYSSKNRVGHFLKNDPNYEYDDKDGVWRYKKKEEKIEESEEDEAEAYYDALVDKAMNDLEETYNVESGLYEPDINKCSMYELEIYDYCEFCKNYNKCWCYD